MRYLLLPLILAGCATVSDFPTECERYGVRNTGDQYVISDIYQVTTEQAQYACGKNRAGCIKVDDGRATIYYRTGDKCALQHELAHAWCGLTHTVAYTQAVIAGHPRPYCPNFR